MVKPWTFWVWKAPEAPEIEGSPVVSPRSIVPLSRSTFAAKIGESAANLAPVSIKNNDSESEMLCPSPPII